jgi:hypothetical protein
MTVRLMLSNRKLNFWDKVLFWAGRTRLPIMPVINIGQEYARYGLDARIQISCEWQGFWAALWNPKVKPNVRSMQGVHKGLRPLFFVRHFFTRQKQWNPNAGFLPLTQVWAGIRHRNPNPVWFFIV